jgi:hypothetical protein
MTDRIGHMLPATAFAAALGLALAGPAFAQSTPGAGGASSGGSQASGSKANGSQASGSQAGTGQQAQTQAMGQDKLRQQLTQAGFRDVKILDAAYLVQARTQDGNDVMMMINPPASGTRTSGTKGGSSATGSTGTTSPNASGGGSSSQQGSGSTR